MNFRFELCPVNDNSYMDNQKNDPHVSISVQTLVSRVVTRRIQRKEKRRVVEQEENERKQEVKKGSL